MEPNILIIDDSKTERLFFKRLAEKAGFRATDTDNWNNISKAAKDRNYDMVFVDFHMPGVSGFSLLEQIREEMKDRISEDRIFLLCDEDEPAGHPFIEKPVTFDKLYELAGLLAGDDTETEEDPSDTVRDDAERYTEVDRLKGIENCGSEDGYRAAIDTFLITGASKIAEINNYFDSADWKNYAIKVHALKSSARIIGAMELGRLAEELEHAGKAEDTGIIYAKTGTLISAYERLLDNLSEDTAEEEAGAPIDQKILDDAISSIKEFASFEDYDMIEMVLDDLKKYKLPSNYRSIFDDIKLKLLMLDWDGIKEVLV